MKKINTASECISIAEEIIQNQDLETLISLMYELKNYHIAHRYLKKELHLESTKLREIKSPSDYYRAFYEGKLQGMTQSLNIFNTFSSNDFQTEQ